MNLVERVKRILMSPRTEWEVIDTEPTTPAQLYTGYIAPLAAIAPIAQLIGYSVFGISVPFIGTYRVPLGSAITSAIVTYVMALAMPYLLGADHRCPGAHVQRPAQPGPGAEGGGLFEHRQLGSRNLRSDPGLTGPYDSGSLQPVPALSRSTGPDEVS